MKNKYMLTLELSSSVLEIPNDAYSRVLQAYCLILENNAKETKKTYTFPITTEISNQLKMFILLLTSEIL